MLLFFLCAVACGGGVTGEIVLPAGAPSLAQADIRVSVEDVTYADGPSTKIGEAIITGASGSPVSFSVSVGATDANNRYAVQVLVDVNRDGQTSKGDFVNDTSIPVLTQGAPTHVTVPVILVR